ncbi:hypothetical protein J6590_011143, partial [Homalodisca vitripennis]
KEISANIDIRCQSSAVVQPMTQALRVGFRDRCQPQSTSTVTTANSELTRGCQQRLLVNLLSNNSTMPTTVSIHSHDCKLGVDTRLSATSLSELII